MDDTVLQKADGNIEFNPTDNVLINGDLLFGEGFSIPGPTVTNVMYVTLDGDDANDGLGEGPNQAKRTLKSACAVAQEGTTIYVRSGEYYENNPIRVPPKVSIVGDTLRTTIIRPLNGPLTYTISNVERTDGYVTVTTLTSHGLTYADRVRIDCVTFPSIDDTTANIVDVPTPTTFRYKDFGTNIASAPATGTVKKGFDLFHVNSADYIAQIVFKGMQSPAFCVAIDSDAIVDTSPYVQNCSNINGPWMRNGVEWLPFQTEQPDLNGTMVTGPRPLLDNEIFPASVGTYGINIEGGGGGMLIDGDKYNSQSPIKSMVGDAFTQVAQGGVGFHITNFGYMQLVSCFAVFCSKAFYTTKGGYLSISNSVCDFGTEAFVADGYYPIPYGTGVLNQNYYSTVGSITVSEEGAGYTVAPSVTIDPPTTPGGLQATATAVIDPILQKVVSIQVDFAGSGYDFQPNISFSGGGAGVTVTAAGVVNLSKNLTIDVFEISNKPQVGSIMFLGNDTTGYYISATGSPSFTFKYDEQKCRRDVGYIVDAVLGDMVFNSNHQSVYAGLSYLRSYSSKVTSLQKAQTIAGIQKAKTDVLASPSVVANATATTRITGLFNTIVNIINLGVSAAPSISIPFAATREPGFAEAGALLVANKNFIKDEIEAWIDVNYPAFTYDVATCKRDIEYIIDALAYDLTYEGNGQTRNAALAYAAGNVIAGQIDETQAAYEYWQTIIGKIVKSQTVTPTVGNTTPQVTGSVGSPLDPNEPASTAEALLEYIINVVDHGTGYVPELTVLPNYGYGNATLNTIRNTVFPTISTIQESVIDFLNNAYGGSIEVTTFPPIQSALSGTDVRFHNVSTVSTASTAMEYVGAGVTYNALPFFGGEPIPANERIEINNGKCFTVTSDQIGNYRIGEFFTVNAITGEVTIDAENINLQGLSAIGPFKRNGIPVGVQLREFSDNTSLIASNGLQDVNTAPSQRSVSVYVQNNYLNKVQSAAQTIVGPTTFSADIGVNGGDLYSTATTFNLLNRDGSGSIADDGPTTINAFLNAGTINIAHTTSNTNINGNLVVKGSIVSSPQASVDLLDTTTATVNAFGAATAINIGASTGSFIVDNPTITFTNATNINVNGANPTLASTSTGTLTLFDTLITTVNAFRSATTINIGESSGTLTIKSANTVIDGDLQIKGGDLTTNQTTFNLLNTTATTVNAFGAATAINIGGGSGLSTFTTNFKVNLNSTLGTDTTSANIFNGTLTANIRDNIASSFEILESTNSYIKLNTTNSVELIEFGALPKVSVLNTTDASSTTVASTIFAGGVGIAKKLYVGTDLNVAGSTTLGDDRTADTHTISGVTTINVPDNIAIAFQIKENTQTYITAVTTDNSESVTIEATPKLLVKNTTDNTLGTAASGSAQFTGGVGIAKNLTVGTNLTVNTDIVATGDLAVNGGDFTTTAVTFNILNGTATTINFGGAGTAIAIGAATGTTNIKHNLDVDGDVNIDGGDLTVGTATFNLADTTATTINFGGASTAFNLGASAGSLTTFTLGNVTNSGNIFKVRSTTAGTIYYTTDVTTGGVEAWQSVTGTVKIGASGTITLGTSASATTTTVIGGGITGNTLKIAGTTAGTVNLTTDVTTGIANIVTSVTGNINIGGAATTVNIGTTGGNSIVEVRGASSGSATIRTSAGVTTANVFNTVTTTGNLFGEATSANIATSAATASTLTFGAAFTANVFKINSIAAGTITLSSDVTTGIVNLYTGVTTGTVNLATGGASTTNIGGAAAVLNVGTTSGDSIIELRANATTGTATLRTSAGGLTANVFNTVSTTGNLFGVATGVNVGTSAATLSTLTFGPAITGNIFKIGSVAAGTINLTSDVTTGIVNAYTGVTTGTINLATGGASTTNIGGAAAIVNIGTTGGDSILEVRGNATTGTATIRTNTGATTANVFDTVATTGNLFGVGTTVNVGTSAAAASTLTFGPAITGNIFKIGSVAAGTINLTSDVTTGIVNAYTGVTTGTVNIATGGASTTNIGGAAAVVNIGTTGGNSILEVRGNATTGTATIRTNTGATTANVFDTVATTGNVFGVATAVNVGISAATLSTLTFGPAITGNIFKISGTAGGTINLTTDVTTGTVNAWQSVTGTTKIGASGTVQLGTSATAVTTVQVGGAITGNTIKINGTAAGTVTVSSDVTTGQVDLFAGVTTGTLNLATGGASTVNIGGTGSTTNIKQLTLTTNLAVQYGGTGLNTITTNGVVYGNGTSAVGVTAASVPGSNAITSYGILTTDVSNVPVWTDTIDGGSY